MAFDIPIIGDSLGSMGDFSGAVGAWTTKLTNMNQLDTIGLITIGIAAVLVFISLAAILETYSSTKVKSTNAR